MASFSLLKIQQNVSALMWRSLRNATVIQAGNLHHTKPKGICIGMVKVTTEKLPLLLNELFTRASKQAPNSKMICQRFQ